MCVRNEKIKLIETNISKVNEIQVASIRFTGQYTELDKYIPLLYKADRKHLFSTLTYNYVHSRKPHLWGFLLLS